VRPHKFYERDGNDLHCFIPISFPQAALGAEITLATLDGDTRLKIPEGAQSGQEFRIRGKGVPHLNEYGRGDLIAQIIVRTPTKLTKAQKELLKQLGETVKVENTPTARSLLEKVKEMFS
jgi:molecular chaperone DnaJ